MNGSHEVRWITGKKERNAACSLIVSVIGAHSPAARKKVAYYLREAGTGSRSDIVAVLCGGKPVGAVQVVERRVMFFGTPVTMAGVTNVCVEQSMQKQGIGRALMEGALRLIAGRGYIASLLFARRAVDGLYGKFGYIGTGA